MWANGKNYFSKNNNFSKIFINSADKKSSEFLFQQQYGFNDNQGKILKIFI
jgi:hypothetical protein